MIHRPYFFRSTDDESAPIDYTFAPSVSEGRRRQQAQNIQKAEPQSAVVRHRADPFTRDAVDEYGTRERRVPNAAQGRGPVPRGLASIEDGPAPAASIAYPQADEIPDNPFDPPVRKPVQAAPRRSSTPPAASGERPSISAVAHTAKPSQEPPVYVAPDGSQYEPPITPAMPEWLRVAQQNNLPSEESLRRAPLVQPAPSHVDEAAQDAAPPAESLDMLGRPIRSRVAQQRIQEQRKPPRAADLYAQAGYPPELIEQQQRLENERAALLERRRHGAQYAVHTERDAAPDRRSAQAAARASYPPSRDSYARRAPSPEERISTGEVYEPENQSFSRGAAYAAASAERQPRTRRQSSVPDGPNGYQQLYSPSAGYVQEPSNPYAQPSRQDSPYRDPDNDLWTDEESDQAPMYRERAPIPWLGIAMFAAALVAVGLWLMQLTFISQTEQVIRARKESHDALMVNHPYSYEELIERESEKNNLHPAFVAAIVLNESSFNPKAESSVGARGLMQVMDTTAQFVYEKLNGTSEGYQFDDLYTAETNVEFGCWYLAYLSDRFRGDPVLVAAGYHAGPTEVQNWLNSSTYSSDSLTIELENMKDGPTKQYATRVLRDYSIYKKLYYETTEEQS